MAHFSTNWSANDPFSLITREQKHGLKHHKHQKIEQGKGYNTVKNEVCNSHLIVSTLQVWTHTHLLLVCIAHFLLVCHYQEYIMGGECLTAL